MKQMSLFIGLSICLASSAVAQQTSNAFAEIIGFQPLVNHAVSTPEPDGGYRFAPNDKLSCRAGMKGVNTFGDPMRVILQVRIFTIGPQQVVVASTLRSKVLRPGETFEFRVNESTAYKVPSNPEEEYRVNAFVTIETLGPDPLRYVGKSYFETFVLKNDELGSAGHPNASPIFLCHHSHCNCLCQPIVGTSVMMDRACESAHLVETNPCNNPFNVVCTERRSGCRRRWRRR